MATATVAHTTTQADIQWSSLGSQPTPLLSLSGPTWSVLAFRVSKKHL